jgi:hypothetical protein
VHDEATGSVKAFVLDGEMEDFIRIGAASFEVVVWLDGERKALDFQAVSDVATGEKVGDTSCFEASAEWLNGIQDFDAVLTAISIRGAVFSEIPFNFPNGNEVSAHRH